MYIVVNYFNKNTNCLDGEFTFRTEDVVRIRTDCTIKEVTPYINVSILFKGEERLKNIMILKYEYESILFSLSTHYVKSITDDVKRKEVVESHVTERNRNSIDVKNISSKPTQSMKIYKFPKNIRGSNKSIEMYRTSNSEYGNF